MELSKFSAFKKERVSIKESRLKESKVKKFNKVFSEKLKEMNVTSIADLTEDQVNSFLESLKSQKPVNEDRMREIEADVIAAGKPQQLGAEGSKSESERAKKHTFDSPQNPVADAEAKVDAEELQAEGASVEEAKSTKGEDDEEKLAHYKDAAKDDYAQIAALKKDAHDDKETEDDLEDDIDEATKAQKAEIAQALVTADKETDDEEEEEVEEVLEGKEIKSDAEFDKYADEVLKKAHPDDFDEKIAKKIKDGLKKKYGDDYGAAVGALTSGFGG